MVNRKREDAATNGNTKGHIKFRYSDPDKYLDLDMEGISNEAVADGLKSIATALAGRAVIAPRTLTRPAAPQAAINPVAQQPETTDAVDEPEVAEPEITEPGSAEEQSAEPKAKYNPPPPTYVHDLDLKGTGSPSFVEYAKAKAPTKHVGRYLTAALWLKEYGNSPTITVDKVYTCYKTAGWPLRISDWDVNFRNMVKSNKFRRVSPKEYAITPLGEAELQESGKAATA
jgi:hypothetical protein